MRVTQEGYNKIKQELENLEKQERPMIAKLLKDAIAEGDLSENAAYEEGKNRQSLMEGRIHELKKILSSAEIEQIVKGDKIRIGSHVTVKNSEGTERIFNITDEQSANPAEGKISYSSPLGAAFVGHKKGDSINVETPSGKKFYKILDVT